MTHLATVSPKFQVSLPKALRDRLGLRPGDRLVVEEKGATSSSLLPPRSPRTSSFSGAGAGRRESCRPNRTSRPGAFPVLMALVKWIRWPPICLKPRPAKPRGVRNRESRLHGAFR